MTEIQRTQLEQLLSAPTPTGIPPNVRMLWDWIRFRRPARLLYCWADDWHVVPALLINGPIVPARAFRVHALPPDPERGFAGIPEERAGWYVGDPNDERTWERAPAFSIFGGRPYVFLDNRTEVPSLEESVRAFVERYQLRIDPLYDGSQAIGIARHLDAEEAAAEHGPRGVT